MKLISWNVNGLRSVLRKDLWSVLDEIDADVIALQETKSNDSIMQDLVDTEFRRRGYSTYWHSHSTKNGYSGVCTFSRMPATEHSTGFGLERFDVEGRVVLTRYADFTLLNVYFPNGCSNRDRLAYKMDFYAGTTDYIQQLRTEGHQLLICGDFNTAHHPADLHDPQNNLKTSGFLPEERAWLDSLVELGFTDTFRQHQPSAVDAYSWWDYRTRAKERNKGWRIDYFFVDAGLRDRISDAFILPQYSLSDHCPVGIRIAHPA